MGRIYLRFYVLQTSAKYKDNTPNWKRRVQFIIFSSINIFSLIFVDYIHYLVDSILNFLYVPASIGNKSFQLHKVKSMWF